MVRRIVPLDMVEPPPFRVRREKLYPASTVFVRLEIGPGFVEARWLMNLDPQPSYLAFGLAERWAIFVEGGAQL